jgi:hypothetical protein
MEILRLALATSKDAREALALAQEMAAFVAGADNPSTPPAPVAVDVAPPAKRAPKTLVQNSNRAGRAWNEEEKTRAAAMLDAGASYAAAGKVIGRTARAIQAMRSSGELPVKKHVMNDVRRLSGALGAVAQGFKINAALFKSEAQ